jgi:hypothetical protein
MAEWRQRMMPWSAQRALAAANEECGSADRKRCKRSQRRYQTAKTDVAADNKRLLAGGDRLSNRPTGAIGEPQ